MKLIVGLGNPGAEYSATRHNLGWQLLDKMAEGFKLEPKLEAEITKKDRLIYAKPQTFMNESGRAVKKIADYYKIAPTEIVIVHDDKDLLLGQLRWRTKGSAGGHRGVDSVIKYLKTQNFSRLKMGTARAGKIKDTSKFVLGRFSLWEKNKAKKMVTAAAEMLLNKIKSTR